MSDSQKSTDAQLMIHGLKPSSPRAKTETEKTLEDRLNSIFNENTAARITREVAAQASGDFFLNEEQVKALGLLNDPAPTTPSAVNISMSASMGAVIYTVGEDDRKAKLVEIIKKHAHGPKT